MTMKRVLAGVVGTVGAAVLLAGCPELDNGQTTCVRDTDCGAGQICITATNTCEFTCNSDADCIGDEECIPRPSDGALYCAVDSDEQPTGCDFEDDPTAFCQAQLGDDDAFCLNNTCVIPGEEEDEYYTVYVEDVTTARCGDTTFGWPTNGSKLMHVALQDAQGNYIAFGAAMEFYYGEGGTEDPFFGHIPDVLDGTQPNYEGTCPVLEDQPREGGGVRQGTNFHESAVVAIGCGGEVFIRFFDSAGAAIPIFDGDIIEVNEYGPFCSDVVAALPGNDGHTTQTGDDFYNVSVCPGANVSRTQAEGIFTDPATCIQLNSAPATGLTVHTVSLP